MVRKSRMQMADCLKKRLSLLAEGGHLSKSEVVRIINNWGIRGYYSL